MRNFKKIVPRVLIVMVFLWIINEVGKFLYEPATDNLVVTEADLKDHQGEIETLLLGTSLMHVGMDPSVLSEELDTVCFNLATSSQPLAGSYYLLKDELKRNPIERVFLGVGASAFRSNEGNANTSAKVRVLKLLLSPLEKAEFVATAAGAKELESLIFCPARTKNTLSLRRVKRNVTYKLSQDFKDRKSFRKVRYQYFGMGFESNDKVFGGVKDTEIPEKNIWDRDSLLEGSLNYIRKMAALCEEKGVEFNLVVMPHAEEYSALQGDLADMDAYLEEFTEEISAGLYNYNYTARPDIYTYLPNTSFMDGKHLNQTGAVTLAQLLAEDYQQEEK